MRALIQISVHVTPFTNCIISNTSLSLVLLIHYEDNNASLPEWQRFYSLFYMQVCRRMLGPKYLLGIFGNLVWLSQKGLEAIKDGNPNKAILAGFVITIWAAVLIFLTMCPWPCILIPEPPCPCLDSRIVDQEGNSFSILPTEGRRIEGRMCIPFPSQLVLSGTSIDSLSSHVLFSEKECLMCSVPMEIKL